MTERRGPGRPQNGRPSHAVPPRSVRLDADLDDRLCRLSVLHDVAINRLLKIAARMLAEADDEDLARRLAS